ncbi:hypothetical protein OROMI_031855 [Orobanche minor]
MKLIAEILTGSLFYVEIEEDATIQNLKSKIGNQEKLPTSRLILMLDADDERYLLGNDEFSLKDYGVQDGSHIYIFFQLPDDKPSDTSRVSPSSGSTSSQDSTSTKSPTTPVTPPPPVSSSSDSEEELNDSEGH